MKTPISQSTSKTNAKKYNDYFSANYQTYKTMENKKKQRGIIQAISNDTGLSRPTVVKYFNDANSVNVCNKIKIDNFLKSIEK